MKKIKTALRCFSVAAGINLIRTCFVNSESEYLLHLIVLNASICIILGMFSNWCED